VAWAASDDWQLRDIGIGHFARGMSGWSLLAAITGLAHDATGDELRLDGAPGRYPFLTGACWGVVESDGSIVRLAAPW